jgi:hypothetical protein
MPCHKYHSRMDILHYVQADVFLVRSDDSMLSYTFTKNTLLRQHQYTLYVCEKDQ